MISSWDLPTRLKIGDEEYDIRSDYRDILNVLIAFDDPDLTAVEKQYVCLTNIYPDFDKMPSDLYEEAYKQAVWFIDLGREKSAKAGADRRLVDWEQDASLIFSAVNKVAGREIRADRYLHWWTFMGYFLEMKDSVYAVILGIRGKRSKGKPLEKWEKEFWSANKGICQLRTKLTDEEKAEKERLKALLG